MITGKRDSKDRSLYSGVKVNQPEDLRQLLVDLEMTCRGNEKARLSAHGRVHRELYTPQD